MSDATAKGSRGSRPLTAIRAPAAGSNLLGVGRLAVTRERLRRRLRPAVSAPTHAWFDAPDAADQIPARAERSGDVGILRSWVDNGYAIVESLTPPSTIDAMLADVDGLFDGTSSAARPAGALADVEIHGLQFDDGRRGSLRYPALLRLPTSERIALRERSNWRVHGFFHASPAADKIRRSPELARIASMILGVPTQAPYSINFRCGSTQELHQDSAVFHLGVPNMICGAWIACEDITAGSGPLVYYPGSHRRQMFDGFPGYPLETLRTASPAAVRAYQQHVDAESLAFERHQFLPQTGDVLFWHGMLIHGGDTITAPGTTRKSFVLHYIPAGVDVGDQVTGLLNW